MEWLNYHHLLYFYTVAKEGTVAQAARELHLAQPTVSGQIRLLEESLGEKLFRRQGRNLVLTETGRMVYGYADEIFSVGRELLDTLKGRPSGRPMKLTVGISDAMPKLISHRILEPALQMDPPVQMVCKEDKTERLLAELSMRGFDLVLTEAPLAGNARVKAYNHFLGECGVTFFAAPKLAAELKEGFPKSLDGAPFLVPTKGTLLRRDLEHWFDKVDIRPRVSAEFDDSALLKLFAEHGHGVFAGPSVIADSVHREFEVDPIGATDDVMERFYAITVERRIKHPAAQVIAQIARDQLFVGSKAAREAAEPSTV